MSNYKKIETAHILNIRGTRPERAKLYFSLLDSANVKTNTFDFLSNRNSEIILSAPTIVGILKTNTVINNLYRNLILPYIYKLSNDEIKKIAFELSKVSNKSRIDAFSALYQADVYMAIIFAAKFLNKTLIKEVPSIPGCTSAVALSGATKEGRILACRNMDYPIVGHWEENPVVAFYEPTEPNSVPHVSISTAGVPAEGLTALNKEGISVFTHAHFSKEVSFSGMPVVELGNLIINHAKSISEAIDICRKHKPMGSWAFVIGSAKENRSVTIEMTSSTLDVYEPFGKINAHSNFFKSKELRGRDLFISDAVAKDIIHRYNRICELLTPLTGTLEMKDLLNALRDTLDLETGKNRVIGNTINVVNTIKSVGFDLSNEDLFLSMGSAEYTAPAQGKYLHLNLKNGFDGISHQYFNLTPNCPNLLEAIKNHKLAYYNYNILKLPSLTSEAASYLEEAVRAYPPDDNLKLQLAYLYFKEKKFHDAKEILLNLNPGSVSTYSWVVSRLFLARIYDLLDLRDSALIVYSEAFPLTLKEKELRKAFKKGLSRKFTSSEIESVIIDLQFVDPIDFG